MTDPEIKELIDKAEQLNLMGDGFSNKATS